MNYYYLISNPDLCFEIPSLFYYAFGKKDSGKADGDNTDAQNRGVCNYPEIKQEEKHE